MMLNKRTMLSSFISAALSTLTALSSLLEGKEKIEHHNLYVRAK